MGRKHRGHLTLLWTNISKCKLPSLKGIEPYVVKGIKSCTKHSQTLILSKNLIWTKLICHLSIWLNHQSQPKLSFAFVRTKNQNYFLTWRLTGNFLVYFEGLLYSKILYPFRGRALHFFGGHYVFWKDITLFGRALWFFNLSS